MSDETPDQRQWMKHRRNGKVGWLIERNGKTLVKIDLPDPYATMKYEPNDWELMNSEVKLPRQLVATVQWAADRALMRALGEHVAAGRDWHALTTEQRIEFMDNGPGEKHGEHRKRVWSALKKALKPLVE